MADEFKILYVSYARSGRGDEVHTRQFVDALDRIHPQVTVHTPLLTENVFASEARQKMKAGRLADPFRELRYLAAIGFKKVRQQWAVLRREKPDVVVMRASRYLSMVWLCRLLRIPMVLEVNAPMWEATLLEPSERLRPMALWCWIEARMFALADHIMVVSRPLQDYYLRYGLDAKRLSVVPNGVDTGEFDPSLNGGALRASLNLGDKIVIGFIGSFVPWHGFEFLNRAVDAMVTDNPDLGDRIALLLVGQQKSDQPWSDSGGVTKVVTGKVPFDCVPDYLAAMDIITAPYPVIEPFYFSPLKVLEGMAMAKAVIASDQGQISELITNGENGVLYPAGDQRQFIQALKRLVADAKWRTRLGLCARRTIEVNYTWHINAKSILNLCSRLNRSASRRP